MIVWAEDNKYKGHRNDDFTIPPRTFYNELRGDVIVEWKDDLKFVTKLDRLLSDGETLTKKELEYCNQLYDFYKK